ncbi:MAG TPA: hypothetical protein VF278_17460 [Pirellulales bacterium]
MTLIGPQLDSLLHRLAECPEEFLLPPERIDVVALACDHLRVLGRSIPHAPQSIFVLALPAAQSLAAVVLWLLRDEWFLARPELADASLTFLRSEVLAQLASLVPAEAVVSDADRREELVRLCLKELGFCPAGESEAQAADRLTTLDSVERDRVIRETRSAEARARQVREAMARKRAEEAAARYSPE